MSQAAKIERSRPGLAPYSPKDVARLVGRTTPVDAVGLEERAASLAKRSIKRESKLWALDLAIRCMDLTTLEGVDTTGKIVALCAKAVRPNPVDDSIPSVAAVCLYPQLVPVAVGQLKSTTVKVASVAGAFPAGLAPLDARLAEIREVAELGSALCMMEAARDFFIETGHAVGVKVAGGVRQSKQAIQYLVLLYETLGPQWMTPDLFRIGASTLLNDVLMQIDKERTGHYQGPDYYTID